MKGDRGVSKLCHNISEESGWTLKTIRQEPPIATPSRRSKSKPLPLQKGKGHNADSFDEVAPTDIPKEAILILINLEHPKRILKMSLLIEEKV